MNALESVINNTFTNDKGMFKTAYTLSVVSSGIIFYGGKIMFDHYVLGKSHDETYHHVNDFLHKVNEKLGIKAIVYGIENYIKGPTIICPTHFSGLDIPALVDVPGRKYFGAKKELFYIPFLGQGMIAAGMPVIDRKNHEAAITSIDRAAEMIINESNGKTMDNSAHLVIFPQGTREKNTFYHMGEFKKGAFRLSQKFELPIIPIAIYGGIELLPKGSLCIKPGIMKVSILKPIMPKNYKYNLYSNEALNDAVKDMISDTRKSMDYGLKMLQQS